MRTLQDNKDDVEAIILEWLFDPFAKLHLKCFESEVRSNAILAIKDFLRTGERAFESGMHIAQWLDESNYAREALESFPDKQSNDYKALSIMNDFDGQLVKIFCLTVESLTNIYCLINERVELMQQLSKLLNTLAETMNQDERISLHVEDYARVKQTSKEEAQEFMKYGRE